MNLSFLVITRLVQEPLFGEHRAPIAVASRHYNLNVVGPVNSPWRRVSLKSGA